MLKHRWTDRVCCAVLALTLLVTVLFMGGAAAGVIGKNKRVGYEAKLFDQSRVHTIDLVMNDWDGFLKTCTSEEYAQCTVVIDGEKYATVGIRAKGNTSLSSVAAYGNDRYSFKLEFDHYVSGKSYYGLDKLCLNNIIQDNTYMKDYLAYTLMSKTGVASPLCSFAYVTVNGQDWGLYLAVEAVEDAFMTRNYGAEGGELYKPDSMSFGGGRGNGRDFDMDDFREKFQQQDQDGAQAAQQKQPAAPGGFDPSAMFGQGGMPGEMPQGMTPPDGNSAPGGQGGMPSMPGGFGGFGGFGMGNADVQLQYIDDDPASYSNIFGNAKTDVDEEDQARVIASLKALSAGDASVVDQDAVLRYMAVHNFMCNDDSYTGMMVHNYYLREKDGVLSMIPWDYNLSMGAMGGGFGVGSGATGTVNTPIDTLVSQGDVSSRPMAAWIHASDETTEQYHAVYREFIEKAAAEGWLTDDLDRVIDMIAPYVEKDPTAFCTYEAFQTATASLKQFCALRCESVLGQLDGTIPSTTAGQRTASDALVDASSIELSDMGSMSGMGGPGGDAPGMPGQGSDMPAFGGPGGASAQNGQMPDFSGSSGASAQNGQMPAAGDGSAMPAQGGQMPDFSASSGAPAQNGQMPPAGNGSAMPAQGGQMPDFSAFSGAPASSQSAQTAPATEPTDAPAPETDAPTSEETDAPAPQGAPMPMRGMDRPAQNSAVQWPLLIGAIVALLAGTVFALTRKTHN